jgi:hypothetical protein
MMSPPGTLFVCLGDDANRGSSRRPLFRRISFGRDRSGASHAVQNNFIREIASYGSLLPRFAIERVDLFCSAKPSRRELTLKQLQFRNNFCVAGLQGRVK